MRPLRLSAAAAALLVLGLGIGLGTSGCSTLGIGERSLVEKKMC